MLWAEPCVGVAYNNPLPGATGVELRVSDVPAARFPSFWQTGNFRGFAYKLFSNGDALVTSDIKRPDWKIELDCTSKEAECSYSSIGDVPADASDAAHKIGQCLLGIEDAPVPETAAIPEPEAVNARVEGADVNPGECAASAVPEGDTIITLQRLLLVAGADPGPVDGLIGPSTLNALQSVLGGSTSGRDLDAALEDLRIFLCARE
ncbi:peptidoglycan-binding domain-containing protein [Planktotalea sp.]|uniref:peptidoglycan-binding domain-containing protein n=1 Tax=Planktotalea sp. TaxID=2029877 RepID=UPI003D6C44CA